MDNPEYTARQINRQLAKRTALPITVIWDGDEYADSAPGFYIYLGDEETPFVLLDSDTSFDVQIQLGPNHFANVGWASGYQKVADLIVSVVEEAIADGTVTVEEEEA